MTLNLEDGKQNICSPNGDPNKGLYYVDKPILKIIGKDGNAFAMLGAAKKVAIENDMDWSAIQKEAMSGDYDNLLRTMCEYFEVQ